jgi:hypothetical protein
MANSAVALGEPGGPPPRWCTGLEDEPAHGGRACGKLYRKPKLVRWGSSFHIPDSDEVLNELRSERGGAPARWGSGLGDREPCESGGGIMDMWRNEGVWFDAE